MRKRSSFYRNRRQDLPIQRPPCAAALALVLSLTVAALVPIAPLGAAETLPERLTDSEFRELIGALSEPDGAFQFENLLSNEIDYPHIMAELQRTAPAGGAYLGVGPEQNFSYIAALRPKIAFIIDIRHQNVLEHLMYKALFEMAPDRATFVSRLFSRKQPAGLSDPVSAAELFDAYHAAPPDEGLFQRTFREISDLLQKRGFVFSDADQRSLENVYAAFRDFGPLMDYNSRGGIPGGRGGNTPNYARLMSETDSSGREWSYLASEENYRIVRDLQRRNLIVPLTGDFGGPKAIRAVGQYLKDHGAVVSAFYVSNVEGYLFQGGDRQGNQNGGAAAFYDNAASLPLDRSTTFIRWVPAFGSFGGAGTPSIRLAPIPSTINDYRSGRLTITEFFPGRGRFARMGRGIGSGAAAGILNRARGSGSGQGPASAIDSVFGSGILTHIALATAAFLAGYFIRDPLLPRRRPGAYYAERIMRWRDAVYRYRLGIPSSKTAAFRLSPEQPLDSFFKSIGFRREFQTGDSAFDARIYIESEDEAVRAALKDNAELRQAILDVFANGARSLWSDGRSIYLESRAEQHDQGLRALELARAEITKTWSKMPAHSRDRFAARPRIARAAVWAVAGYAMASLVDAYLSRETLHLDQFRLIAAGGIAAVGAVLALTGITLVLLRSSSRAHRTLVTIALAALLAAPLFGLQVVSDVNRALDRGSITVTATVSRRWEAGTGGAYYIEMAEPLSDALNPGALRVSRDVFRSVRDGMSVPVVIGEGRLDIPWLRSINGVVVE